METAFSEIKMPLGKAILRLNSLHSRVVRGIASDKDKVEHDLIRDALNKTELSLGFDCDGDGVVDVDDVFTKTAATSCCRLVDVPPQRQRRTTKKKSRR